MTDTPFIVLIKAARDLVEQADENIKKTEMTAFEYDVTSALFNLNKIAACYDESVDRLKMEIASTEIREVK